MNRAVAGLLGLSFAIASFAGVANAQDGGGPATVVDVPDGNRGSGRSGQGEDGREVARGDDGDAINYTIIETPDQTAGDATTAVTPTAPPPPDLSRVPGSMERDETTLAPPTGEPVSAPIPAPPPAGAPGDATTADPAAPTAPPAVSCLDFGTWYDAQVYYEAAGGLAAAPDLLAVLDPDGDGVSCEELIAYS